MSEPRFDIKTFGCKVNTYDTGLLQKRLFAAGYLSDPDNPQVHILNSCAVTAEATKEALRQARRIKSKNPLATVVLTGCAAQVDGDILDSVPAIDLVVANSHKNELEEILRRFFRGELQQKVFRSNIFRNEELGEGGGEEIHHTRSYVKIQDGCNSFCSFCIIPFARGKSRSLPAKMIIEKINELSRQGIREVVLTGVHIGDYLDDQNPNQKLKLDDLVEQVLLKTAIPRIRLTSLEPIELTPKLIEQFHNSRMCSHFHMSLQSLSTSVLKGMRRNYTAEQVGEALQWIHREFPQAFVGLDVITGFPGETNELFQETMNNLRQWPWSRIHVFPYSERKGTRATEIEGAVPWEVRKQRAKEMRELSKERFDRLAAEQVGLKKQALVLNDSRGKVRVLSSDYWDIFLNSEEEVVKGELREVIVQGYQRESQGRMNGYLTGSLV